MRYKYLTAYLSCLLCIYPVSLFGHVYGCTDGWLRFDSSCYWFGQDARNWVAASGTCQAHHAELIVIETKAENDFMAKEVNRLKGCHWLDGTDDIKEGAWEWASTGDVFDFKNWYPGEPNNDASGEDCLMTNEAYNGTWNDLPCSRSCKFICEISDLQPVIG